MSYRHYTNEYKKNVVKRFCANNIGIYAFAKKVGIGVKTLYNWLDEIDHDYKTKKTINKIHSKYNYEVKIKAVNKMLLCDTDISSMVGNIGVTKATLYNWLRIYESKGEAGLMSKKDIDNDKSKEIAVLREQLKEKDRQIYQISMQRDVLKATRDMLKNYQGLSLNESLYDLTNLQKSVVISSLRSDYLVTNLLEHLKISSSSYYKALGYIDRPPKYEHLYEIIETAFTDNKRAFGFKRLWKYLCKQGYDIGRDIIGKIYKILGLKPYSKSMKKYNSYDKSADNTYCTNLIPDRNFHAPFPLRKMVTDITEFNIPAGKVYLSPIIDLHDHAVLSWSISTTPNTDMVLRMLDGLKHYPIQPDAILHSDRGCQYHSWRYQWHIQELDIRQSMSKKGCSPDNSACEGFFGRLKQEFWYNNDYTNYSLEEFKEALNEHLLWYNTERIMLGLDGKSPQEYRAEKEFMLYLNKVA